MRLVLAALALMPALCSCTYSITLVHTEGTATDVVDGPIPSTSITTSLTTPVGVL